MLANLTLTVDISFHIKKYIGIITSEGVGKRGKQNIGGVGEGM